MSKSYTDRMDSTLAEQEHAAFGQKTDLVGFFKAMDAPRTQEQLANIRSIIIDMENRRHGSSEVLDHQGK